MAFHPGFCILRAVVTDKSIALQTPQISVCSVLLTLTPCTLILTLIPCTLILSRALRLSGHRLLCPSLALLSPHPWGSSCSSVVWLGRMCSLGSGPRAGQDPQALWGFLGSSLSSDPHECAFPWSQEKPEFPVLSQPWSGVGAQETQAPHGHHRSSPLADRNW